MQQPDGDSTAVQARPQQPPEQTNKERLATYFEMAVDSEDHLDEVHSWIVDDAKIDKGSKLLSLQICTLGSMVLELACMISATEDRP
jgi:hypothetical protein